MFSMDLDKFHIILKSHSQIIKPMNSLLRNFTLTKNSHQHKKDTEFMNCM